MSRLNEQRGEPLERMSAIQDADDMRREFTANVTHELKTPIASISGASELIRDGICRPEDVQGFAGRIYDDARRLSSLVSDILMPPSWMRPSAPGTAPPSSAPTSRSTSWSWRTTSNEGLPPRRPAWA